MCDKEAITLLEETFGGQAKLYDRGRVEWNPIWEWVIRSKSAYIALKKMLPYLRVKRKRAEIAIELAKRVLYHKKKINKITPVEEVKIRKELAVHLKKLNRKGTEKMGSTQRSTDRGI